jgi:uncharacterized protein with HEPN domain
MRPDDQRKYLWDALTAVELLREFTAGKSFEDYQTGAMLRAAVERQFEIIGEALNQLSKVDTGLAPTIPNPGQIVAFRNILIHGYAIVDDALVWQALTDWLPSLATTVQDLLSATDPDREAERLSTRTDYPTATQDRRRSQH